MQDDRAESELDQTLDRILGDRKVCARFDISRSTLWRLSRSDDDFPKKIQISPGRGGRSEQELCAWLEARKEARAFDKDGAQRAMTRPEFPQPDNLRLISVKDACDRSDEKPATIINWCVQHNIGQHVKTGRVGAWMVDPDRLERLLAERDAAS